MIAKIQEYLLQAGVIPSLNGNLSYGILAVLCVLICAVVILAANKIVMRIAAYFISKSVFKWDSILLEKKFFHRIAYITPAIVMYIFSAQFIGYELLLQRAAGVYAVIAAMLLLDALLNGFTDYYSSFEFYKSKPIKGFLQIFKIILICLGIIIIVATVVGESPWIIFTGIGAFSAVLLIIFKDPLLGLAAGIQIASDDMVRIGDWIEMPKYNADGDVVDISLQTVKVENFDHTITTIPAYALVSDSFKNWRNIQEIGGRRIKRSVYIDIGSIAFCDRDMLQGLRSIGLLSEHLESRMREIKEYNEGLGWDTEEIANGRRLTNIGLFRAFLQNYIRSNPGIHPDMVQIVRQLPPTEHGIPLEIYAFSKEVDWDLYEGVQADLFDYIIAIAPRFDLRIYQNPSGADARAKNA